MTMLKAAQQAPKTFKTDHPMTHLTVAGGRGALTTHTAAFTYTSAAFACAVADGTYAIDGEALRAIAKVADRETARFEGGRLVLTTSKGVYRLPCALALPRPNLREEPRVAIGLNVLRPILDALIPMVDPHGRPELRGILVTADGTQCVGLASDGHVLARSWMPCNAVLERALIPLEAARGILVDHEGEKWVRIGSHTAIFGLTAWTLSGLATPALGDVLRAMALGEDEPHAVVRADDLRDAVASLPCAPETGIDVGVLDGTLFLKAQDESALVHVATVTAPLSTVRVSKKNLARLTENLEGLVRVGTERTRLAVEDERMEAIAMGRTR